MTELTGSRWGGLVTDHDHDTPDERPPKSASSTSDGSATANRRATTPPGWHRANPTPPDEADDLARARTQAAEYRDHLQRLQAEFENYRKRMTRSQERLVDASSSGSSSGCSRSWTSSTSP